MDNKNTLQETLNTLALRWPSSIVAREEVARFSGGTLSSKYMANLDSAGDGPPSIRIGRKIAYPVASLIEWLVKRSQFRL